MRLFPWARLFALSGALSCSLASVAGFAHPISFTADPPATLASRAVETADAWLSGRLTDCVEWGDRSRRDVLAIEEAFLAKLRQPRAAAIDAGSPADEDAFDAKPAPANVEESIATDEYNSDNARPGSIEDAKNLDESAWDDQEASDNVAPAEKSGDNESSRKDDSGGNLFVPLIILSDKVADDAAATESTDEDLGVWRAIQGRLVGSVDYCEPGLLEQAITLAQDLTSALSVPSIDLSEIDFAFAANNIAVETASSTPIGTTSPTSGDYPFSALEFWPMVTDEATVQSIIGPRTTAGLNDWRPSGTCWRDDSLFLARRPIITTNESRPGVEASSPERSLEEMPVPPQNFGWELDD